MVKAHQTFENSAPFNNIKGFSEFKSVEYFFKVSLYDYF